MAKEDSQKLLDELNERAVVLDVMEIEGVKPLMERWIKRTIEAKGETGGPIQIPIPQPVLVILTQTRFLQSIRIQMQGWGKEAIRDLSKAFCNQAKDLLGIVGEIRVPLLESKEEDESAKIVNQYSLLIVDYAQKELLQLHTFFDTQHERSLVVPAPDFGEIERRTQRTDFVPLEKRVAEQLHLFFPTHREIKLVKDRPLATGERLLVYEKTDRDGKMTISFTIPKGMDDPTFNRCTQNVFLTAQYYAYIENRLDPFIKREHFIKRLGGGKYKYRILDDSLKHLTIAHYEYSNEAKGKQYYWKVGHLVDEVERYGKGKGSYYQIRLNPTIAQPIQALIENRKPPQFIKLPVHTLFSLPTRKTKAGWVILLLKGLRKKLYPITVRTLLKKMGVTTKEIKIKSMRYLAEELDKGLAEIVNQGFSWGLEEDSLNKISRPPLVIFRQTDIVSGGFTGVVHRYKNLKNNVATTSLNETYKRAGKKPIKMFSKADFLKSKIRFSELVYDEGEKEDLGLVDRITNWLCRPEFKTKKPKPEVRRQVFNTIKKHGAQVVSHIFLDVQNYNPHPREFWNRIKALKKLR